MTATIVAVGLTLLMALNIGILGSYHYDLRDLHERVERAEADVATLTHKLSTFAEWHVHALFERAQQEMAQAVRRDGGPDHG